MYVILCFGSKESYSLLSYSLWRHLKQHLLIFPPFSNVCLTFGSECNRFQMFLKIHKLFLKLLVIEIIFLRLSNKCLFLLLCRVHNQWNEYFHLNYFEDLEEVQDLFVMFCECFTKSKLCSFVKLNNAISAPLYTYLNELILSVSCFAKSIYVQKNIPEC